MDRAPAPQDRSDLLQVYYIRHGETEWAVAGRHTGRTDIPLTPHGEEQARTLAQRLRNVRFTHVLSSPRARARRSCELAGALPAADVDPDLAEWDYGEYEGRTTADIHGSRPDWNIFRDGCPGGESPLDIAARADRLIARLIPMKGNVALFSHGHFGCVLAARWIEQPIEVGQRFVIDPASLGILGHQPRHPELRVITLWNVPPGSTT